MLDALGDAYQSSGNGQLALDSWLQAVRMQGSAAIYDKIAKAYSKLGNEAAARQHLGLAEYERGKQSWLTNDMAQARIHFQAAVADATDFAHAWYYLGETERILGRSQAALDAYQKCLEVDPNHGRAWEASQREASQREASQAGQGEASRRLKLSAEN